MARNPKSWRAHTKVVDEAIRKHGNAAVDSGATPMTPALTKRFDSTWQRMHRDNERSGGR